MCFFAAGGLFLPRAVLVVLWLFSDYLSRAYHHFLWPMLGFFFLPTTTIAYAFAVNSHRSVRGIYLVLVVGAVLIDIGVIGGGRSSLARRRR